MKKSYQVLKWTAAKDYVNNYREDDFFACSAASYVQGVFKIIPKT